MTLNTINFTDEKLIIKIVDAKNYFPSGSVSILYQDISSLSSMRCKAKIPFLIMGILFVAFQIYIGNPSFSYFLYLFGAVFFLWGLILPFNYLGVETRGGSQYLVNIKGKDVFEVINLIDDRRKKNKN
jgi:hypothetical protein